MLRLGNLRHGVGKPVLIDRLRYHRRARNPPLDTLNSVVIRVSGDEDNRHVAHLSKTPSRLDPFAASFETNVHQDNIGLIFQCTQKGMLCICR